MRAAQRSMMPKRRAAAGKIDRAAAYPSARGRAEQKGIRDRSDLASIAAAVASDRAPQAIAAGQELSFDLAGDKRPIWVRGAPFMVAEMIGNLLDNAIRYNRPGGAVLVSVSDDGRPTIAIEDEGPGIPESDVKLVFERFYRVQREGPSGTGLGLSIVRTIADQVGASVALANRAGSGLIVIVQFPAAS